MVREATSDDYNGCFPLLEQLYHGDIGSRFKEVFNKFAGGDIGCVLMAEQHGKTLGVLVGSYYLDIDWEGKVAKIQALIVDVKHRKKGIGKKLVQRLVEKAKQIGCCAVRSRINRKNEIACSFHKKLDFWEAETYEYMLEL
jgi:GNAT superfamily N-acetyltransferase